MRHSVMLMVAAIGLTGCATMAAPGPVSPQDAFRHRASTSELVLFWNCLRPESSLLRVEGMAQNPWQPQPVGYLTFKLVGVDAQERITAQATGAARDLRLSTNQVSPFRLALKTAGTEVRFDLYYDYQFQPESDMGALSAGPSVGRAPLHVRAQTHLVRNACSDTEHLAR